MKEFRIVEFSCHVVQIIYDNRAIRNMLYIEIWDNFLSVRQKWKLEKYNDLVWSTVTFGFRSFVSLSHFLDINRATQIRKNQVHTYPGMKYNATPSEL
jgi:hypothetical protein